jgi:predicted transposase YdaD
MNEEERHSTPMRKSRNFSDDLLRENFPDRGAFIANVEVGIKRAKTIKIRMTLAECAWYLRQNDYLSAAKQARVAGYICMAEALELFHLENFNFLP